MKHEVLICDSCWPILEEVEQFRSNIKGKIAFENKRDEATGSSSKDSRRTRMKICFCRCCLADSFHVNLKVMNGSKTKKLKDISGVDVSGNWFSIDSDLQFFCVQVSKDEGNQAALVCSQCSLFIDKTYNIRVDIKQVDEFYFCFRREEVEESIRLKEINNVKIKKEKISPERDVKTKVQLKSTQKRKIFKEVTRKKKAPEIKKEFLDSKKGKVEAKKWKCKICLKHYSSRNSLKKHLERIHAKIKRFSCDICGLSEYLKENLQAHMIRRHINPTVKPRRFYDKSRPFKCNVPGCSKFFKRKSDLDYHLRIHAGMKFSRFFSLSDIEFDSRGQTVCLLLQQGVHFQIRIEWTSQATSQRWVWHGNFRWIIRDSFSVKKSFYSLKCSSKKYFMCSNILTPDRLSRKKIKEIYSTWSLKKNWKFNVYCQRISSSSTIEIQFALLINSKSFISFRVWICLWFKKKNLNEKNYNCLNIN